MVRRRTPSQLEAPMAPSNSGTWKLARVSAGTDAANSILAAASSFAEAVDKATIFYQHILLLAVGTHKQNNTQKAGADLLKC